MHNCFIACMLIRSLNKMSKPNSLSFSILFSAVGETHPRSLPIKTDLIANIQCLLCSRNLTNSLGFNVVKRLFFIEVGRCLKHMRGGSFGSVWYSECGEEQGSVR